MTTNGLISKPELRGYLRKLGKKTPDPVLKKKIVEKIGQYVERMDATGRKYLDLVYDPDSEKTSTLGSQDHNAIEMNLMEQKQYKKINEAEDVDVAFDNENGNQPARDGFHNVHNFVNDIDAPPGAGGNDFDGLMDGENFDTNRR